jgi:hypothetical protein
MWICKYCKIEFAFYLKDRASKANHSRWCISNPRSKEYREENSKKDNNCWNRGLKNDPRCAHTEESKQKLRQVCTGYASTEEKELQRRLKLSDSMKGNRNANHRGDRQSYYKDIRMDSRWEVGTAFYLDSQNIIWKYSEYGFRLSDGRYYYPDFFIYENDILIKLIEVKGYFRKKNKQKFQQFRDEYPTVSIELWEKDKLKELNIIDSSGYVKNMDARSSGRAAAGCNPVL